MRILIITNKTPNSTIHPGLPHLFGVVNDLFASCAIANAVGRENNSTTNLTAKCDVLIAGYDLTTLANNIASFAIVNQVLQLDHELLENVLAENIAPTLAHLIKEYTHVLIAADSFGKNLLPRIAGILEIGQISEIVKVLSPNTFKKFMYAGNVLVEIESLEEIKLLTVRTNNFKAEETLTKSPAPIKQLAYDIATVSKKIKFISAEIVDNIDLSNAKIIVTGGRSLGSRETFDTLIRTLAHKLNAGVGASRAAVDAGYAHNDCQIGQTGKVVAPNVYLAFGISGAVQHIAGMKDSKTVIAINLDNTAPIFEHADYGLVADLFTVIPELISHVSLPT